MTDTIPVRLRVGDAEEREVATISEPGKISRALRAVADECDLQADPRRPVGATIDIIEKRRESRRAGSVGDELVVPNEVRINGQPLLMPNDEPIIVHEMALADRDVVRVTLTLFARRITIAGEDPEVADV